MPLLNRKKRCCAEVFSNSNYRKCKRNAIVMRDDGDCEKGLCSSHVNMYGDVDICACCMKFVEPRSNDHLEPDCGHSLHFECARKWIDMQPQDVKTCPTCRTPFSHCLAFLLDDRQVLRQIVKYIGVMKCGAIFWRFLSIESLVDAVDCVSRIIGNENSLKHISLLEDQVKKAMKAVEFKFATDAGLMYNVPFGQSGSRGFIGIVDNLKEFVKEGKLWIAKYKEMETKCKYLHEKAKKLLSNGKSVRCKNMRNCNPYTG